MTRTFRVLAATALLAPVITNAQPAEKKFNLTDANIMRGPELY